MLRTLVFVAIAVALLSPVSAQQLAEPLAFNLNVFAAQGLAGTGQHDPSCVIGNGGSLVSPAPSAGGPQAASLPFSPGIPHAFAGVDLPLLTLPDFQVDGARVPRSLTWLPGSEALFANPANTGGLAYDLPLLFPGLGRRNDFFSSNGAFSDLRSQAALHDSRRDKVIHTAARPERSVVSSAPSSVLPAGMQDAFAGLHRLWNCVGTDASQLGFAIAAAPAASAALPAAPSWEVNELANNLGGLGRIYRATYANAPALVVNRLVSATQEELAFRVTQAEFNSAGVGCFKASADNRIAATKQDNGNAVISMGPDHENKTFHVVFNGGVHGQVGGTVTGYGGAPGAACS